MPLYRYRCEVCRTAIDAMRRVDDRDRAPVCHGRGMIRQIMPTMVSVFNPYRTVAADKESGSRITIKNRAEHEAFLRRNGYEEVGNDKSMAPPCPEEIAAHKPEPATNFEWMDPDV